jgi:hypothetical protein
MPRTSRIRPRLVVRPASSGRSRVVLDKDGGGGGWVRGGGERRMGIGESRRQRWFVSFAEIARRRAASAFSFSVCISGRWISAAPLRSTFLGRSAGGSILVSRWLDRDDSCVHINVACWRFGLPPVVLISFACTNYVQRSLWRTHTHRHLSI